MSLHAELSLERGAFRLDAELHAAAGETLALLGPNGAGKSTLLAALAGLVPLDAGRVVLDGSVLEDTAAGLRLAPEQRDVGVVFQDLRLFPALDVTGNVAYGLRARGVPRRQARRRAGEQLVAVAAADLAGRRVQGLSGGQAQRVALARALAVTPRLLLLDEPLSALDVHARGATRALLRRVLPAFSGPRVLVTHEPVEALALADRLAVLEGGRVVQDGSPDEVRQRPRSPFVAALVGLNLLRGRLRRDAGRSVVAGRDGELTVVADDLPAGSEVLVTCAPSAVALHDSRPHGSARNVLPAVVADVELDGARARVRLDARPSLVAEVTAAAVLDLQLAPGDRVWASVKATELRVEPLDTRTLSPFSAQRGKR